MSCSKFRCPLCVVSQLFASRENVLKHAEKFHKIAVSRCQECDILLVDLGNHQASTHDGKPFKCPFCTMCFADTNNRAKHYEEYHAGRIGLYSAPDGLVLDKNYSLPSGTQLQDLMDSLGFPNGYTIDASNVHYIVALDRTKRPIFTFHVMTPSVVASKTPHNRHNPKWWHDIVNSQGTDKGHLVPPPDIAHLDDPHQTATTTNNWVFMESNFNRGTWYSLERFIRKLAGIWQEVIIFTAVQYGENSDPVKKMPIKIGKAVLLRRGKEEKLICFVLANGPVTGNRSFLSYMKTLEEFCQEMNLEFFGKCKNKENLKTIQDKDTFRCQLHRCSKQFLDKTFAKAHSDAHVKQNPKGKKRNTNVNKGYIVCLRCPTLSQSPSHYKVHITCRNRMRSSFKSGIHLHLQTTLPQ